MYMSGDVPLILQGAAQREAGTVTPTEIPWLLILGGIVAAWVMGSGSRGRHLWSATLFFLLLGCGGNRYVPPPPVVSRVDTVEILVPDTVPVYVTDTLRDTVEIRRADPLTIVVAPAPLGDSIYKVRAVQVKPDNVIVKPGDTVRYCPMLTFKAGQWALPAEYAEHASCRALYLTATGQSDRWRQPDAMQQFVADRTCFKWEAEGGTITARLCE